MKRHNFDPLSFSFAVMFIVLSVMLWFGVNLATDGVQWLGAGALMLLGASLLLSSRKRPRDDR